MTRSVLDASALLALLLGEEGADRVKPHLAGGCVSAVNYSEVLTRATHLCGSFDEAKRRVDRHNWTVVGFDAAQAALAASLLPLTRPLGLSLGDRVCLALGLSLGSTVVTADRAWGSLDLGIRIELIR